MASWPYGRMAVTYGRYIVGRWQFLVPSEEEENCEIPKNLYQKQRTKAGKNQLKKIFFSCLGRAHRARSFGVEFVENYPY